MKILTPLCIIPCWVAHAVGQCSPPQYRTGLVLEDSADVRVENIGVRMDAFAPSKLLCLSSILKKHYIGRHLILISIFSSYEAASEPIHVVEDAARGAGGRHRLNETKKAVYVFDAMSNEEYIRIFPVGVDLDRTDGTEGPYSTQIDLPVVGMPHCRLEIHSRCLIALKSLTYPEEALKRRAEGKVTLVATIARDGRIERVRAANSKSAPKGEMSRLVSSSIDNLSSWRLEPGAQGSAIEITFSYVIDDSLPNSDPLQVEWALPTLITIKGKPAR